MKQFISIFLAILQFLGVSLCIIPINSDIDYGGTKYSEPVMTNPVTLISNGESDYVIVRSASASPSEVTASTELQKYLAQISGVTLPIVIDNDTEAVPLEIIVGTTSRDVYDGIPTSEHGDEGFTLKAAGTKLVIVGGAKRGTLYGVYTFLEERLGCRWFTPTLEVVPEKSTVQFSGDLNDTQSPDFEVRRSGAIGSKVDGLFKKKTNVVFGSNSKPYGGSYEYVMWDVSMTNLVPDSLFETDPTLFSYNANEGKRTTQHVCMTNPDSLAYAIKNAKEYIDADTKGSQHIHLGQKDVGEYCKCESCLACYKKYGSVSAATIIFANRLSDALTDAGYNIYVTFYAYLETAVPPEDTSLKCGDKVIPVVCGSHTSCRAHTYEECGYLDSNENDSLKYRFSQHDDTKFSDDIIGWRKVADRIYIYDYTINFINNQLFFSDFETLQPNAKFLYSQGVTGYTYTCGDGHVAAFNELRNYLYAKVMWDTDCDVEYHMNDFLKAYYGDESAIYIKKYIDYLTAKIAASTHATDTDWSYQSAFYTFDTPYLNSLWKKALASDMTEQQRYHTETSEISWRYTKAVSFLSEYNFLNPMRAKNQEALYDDMLAHGIIRVTSFSALPAKESIDFFFSSPQDWR